MLEAEQKEISLVVNWEEIHKPGQVKVYVVEYRDKGVIDSVFKVLHKQGWMKRTNSTTPFSFSCFVI